MSCVTHQVDMVYVKRNAIIVKNAVKSWCKFVSIKFQIMQHSFCYLGGNLEASNELSNLSVGLTVSH